MSNVWRKCSICSKEIMFGKVYQVCNVSTCKNKFVYCSVDCWEEHLPVMNHKQAWAEENRAPFDDQRKPVRKIITTKPSVSKSSANLNDADASDILVVASKLKKYVKTRAGLNTSAEVMETISDIIRSQTDKAIEKAIMSERKTLMSRDF